MNCKSLLIFLFYSFAMLFQGYGQALDTSKAEKIYLQLSSNAYALDQDIWFKAIATDGEDHMPTGLSGVLYVDLIGPNEQIIAHKLIKLVRGIGHGFFELPKDALPGRYLIRSYTQWNLNFGEDFMFKAYIDLYSPHTNEKRAPIESLALVEKEPGRWMLTGLLHPKRMGDESEKRVQVYLDWGYEKDTVSIRSRAKDTYLLEYEVPGTLDRISLTLDNGQGLRHTETIVLNGSATDLQFFPESGAMVHGYRNKIGFKAVGVDGRGKVVQGAVFDAHGTKITTFESNPLGMGIFFIEADTTATYHAKLFSTDNIDPDVTYPLPKAMPKGSILSVARAKDKIRMRISSSTLAGRISIKASCRGTDLYLMEGQLRDGYLTYELPSHKLPAGIIALTLMDGQQMPVAERLYFNEVDLDRLEVALTTDSEQYGRRMETGLDIQVTGKEDVPTTVDMSVMVINKEHWHQGMGETIRSYFLLSSELRGEVEDPGYYFRDEGPDRSIDLDALLLTQGWRNYKYPVTRQGNSFFWPQRGLEIKGTVRSTFPKNGPAGGVDITLVAFGQTPSFYAQTADSLGRFHFLMGDDYGKRMRVLLNAKKGEKKKTNYALSLDTLRIPKIVFAHRPVVQNPDKVALAVVGAQEKRQRLEMIFDSLYGVTQLDEVVVKGYRLTPEREKAYKKFGEPDVIIAGDAIRKKEKKWSYGLYSILLFNYGDQIVIEEFPDGFSLAHIRGGRGEPTLLLVDGRLLTKDEYEFVPQMPADNVESVELIKYAKFFKSLFLTVFPETHPLDAPNLGHVISIYTKGGAGIHGTGRPLPGNFAATMEVFSPVKEFYAPKYDGTVPDNGPRPDLRSLIYWVPSIGTDRSGNASVRFYNGDIPGDYIIIVEAISGDGRLGYQEKEYRLGHVKNIEK